MIEPYHISEVGSEKNACKTKCEPWARIKPTDVVGPSLGRRGNPATMQWFLMKTGAAASPEVALQPGPRASGVQDGGGRARGAHGAQDLLQGGQIHVSISDLIIPRIEGYHLNQDQGRGLD
ncbi:uncharacterized protein LOC114352150 [Ostrinia furnacalis]|uniref:uncharacterized protein LOC114352150 n=1 Tax=Ostrinia furnacalis TaxID=93504 RepID=UPI00103EF1EC|nr:uncharacterized protein LOC114352150 [Ostrinia furnacalis]